MFAGSLALGAQNAQSRGSVLPRLIAASSPSDTAVPEGAASPAQAQQGSNLVREEDEEDTSAYRHSASVRAVGKWFHLDPDSAARVFEYVNFALLAGAILFFLLRSMPGILRTRRETLQKQLVEARTATEEANARLAAVEQRFARLEDEIAKIRAQAEQEGAAEEARMKDLIETERQRVVSSAEQEIAAAAATARRQLRRFAGELAVDRAAQMISLSEDGDRILVRQFVQELGDQPRNGGRA